MWNREELDIFRVKSRKSDAEEVDPPSGSVDQFLMDWRTSAAQRDPQDGSTKVPEEPMSEMHLKVATSPD